MAKKCEKELCTCRVVALQSLNLLPFWRWRYRCRCRRSFVSSLLNVACLAGRMMWARNLNICQNTIFYWTNSTNENQREISLTLLEFMHGCSACCNLVPCTAQLRGTLMKFVKRFQWCTLLAEAFKQLWQHIIFTCYGCPFLLVSVSFEWSSLLCVTSSCKLAREIWLRKRFRLLLEG